MSTPSELFVADLTYVATEAITEGYAVKVDDSAPYACQLADSAGEKILGIAEYDAASGDPVRVIKIGLVKCVAGEAISIGDKLSVLASGKIQVAASGEHPIGYAEQAASGDGKLFSAWIQPSLIPLA